MTVIFDRRYPVTSAVLLITVINFLLLQILRFGQATTSYAIYEFGGLLGRSLQQDPSQIWRLFTAMFVHIGWEHILFNGLAVYFLGRQMEDILGSLKFAVFYLLSGLMGNAFVFALSPSVVTAGASTAIYGMFASLVVWRYFVRNPYIKALGQSYLILLVINLVMSFLFPGISLIGHIGGAAGGALCAVFLPVKGEEQAFTKIQRGLH